VNNQPQNTGPKRTRRPKINLSTEEEEFLCESVKGDGTPEIPGGDGTPEIPGVVHEAATSGRLQEEKIIGEVKCKKWADSHTIETIKRGMQILRFHRHGRVDT